MCLVCVCWLSREEPACDVGDLGSILGQEDLLEGSMATHCSVLAWRIPRTEEPGGLKSDTTEVP